MSEIFSVARYVYPERRNNDEIPRREICDPRLKILTPGQARQMVLMHGFDQALKIVKSTIETLDPEFEFTPTRNQNLNLPPHAKRLKLSIRVDVEVQDIM